MIKRIKKAKLGSSNRDKTRVSLFSSETLSGVYAGIIVLPAKDALLQHTSRTMSVSRFLSVFFGSFAGPHLKLGTEQWDYWTIGRLVHVCCDVSLVEKGRPLAACLASLAADGVFEEHLLLQSKADPHPESPAERLSGAGRLYVCVFPGSRWHSAGQSGADWVMGCKGRGIGCACW